MSDEKTFDESFLRWLEFGLDHQDWATAFEHLIEHRYADTLASLVESTESTPPLARKLLAQHLKGEIQLGSGVGKFNSKVSPPVRDEVRVRLDFLSRNVALAEQVLSEIADELGDEPIDVQARLHGYKKRGVKRLAEHFGLSASTVGQQVKASQYARWEKFFHGRAPLMFHGKKFTCRYPESLEETLALVRNFFKYPEIYFDPLSDLAIDSLGPHVFDDNEASADSEPYFLGKNGEIITGK